MPECCVRVWDLIMFGGTVSAVSTGTAVAMYANDKPILASALLAFLAGGIFAWGVSEAPKRMYTDME